MKRGHILYNGYIKYDLNLHWIDNCHRVMLLFEPLLHSNHQHLIPCYLVSQALLEDHSFTCMAIFTAVGIACYSDGCICHERVCLSVCLSVRLSSVTFRCFVERNEAAIMRFSPSGRAIILVSGEVKIVWKFARDHP